LIFAPPLTSNVLVIAPTPHTEDIQKLAKLENTIIEVATLSILAIQSLELTTEVQQLCTEVTHYINLCSYLKALGMLKSMLKLLGVTEVFLENL